MDIAECLGCRRNQAVEAITGPFGPRRVVTPSRSKCVVVCASAKKPPPLSPTRHMIAGTAAGVLSTVMLHPLDVIKVRRQVSDGLATNVPTYRGTVDAFQRIMRGESFRALYQGIGPAVTGAGSAWGLYFFFYERAKRRYLSREQQTASAAVDGGVAKLNSLHHAAAAWEASTVVVLMLNPVWLVKTRMQLQVAEYQDALKQRETRLARRYPSMWGSFRWILKNEGFFGLYRGLLPALVLTSHGVVQFSVYEKLKTVSAEYGEHWAIYFALGAVSKVAAAGVTYPGQVIKSRLMQDAEVTGTKVYAGVVEAITRTFRNEGVAGFYKGMAPHLYRGVLSSAIVFVVYEKISRLLRDDPADSSA